MTKYLISFPSAAMVVPADELEAVGRAAHAVIDEAKAAGVYVFGGGIDEDIPPVLVSADGAVAGGGYPWAPTLNGGFTVLELPSRDEAIAWAARIAQACRCDQELRVFGFVPQS
jgi:hypothetical protein